MGDTRPVRTVSEARWDTTLIVAASVIAGSALVMNPAGFDQFQLPKLVIQSVATVIAVAAVLVTRGPVVHRAFVPLAALLVVLVLAALLSDAVDVAIVGSPARRFGLIQWFVLAGAFVVGSTFAASERRRVLVAVLLATSSGVAAYAVVQRLGWDPFDQDGASTRFRPGSTFGSAALLGGYLATVVAVGVASLVGRLFSWRWLGPVLVLDAVALVLSQSRAAWIGAVVAVVVVLGLQARRDPSTRPLVVRSAVAALFVVVITALAVPGIVTRASSLTAPTEGTAGGRIELARMGVGAVLERPILGWGPDLSRAAMRAQVDDGFERDYGDERIEDRAHNTALDLAIFGGLPAVVAGAWFLIEVVRSGWSRRDDVASRAVLLGLLAFGAHLAFNFPVPELDAVVWLFAGTLVASRSFDGFAVPSLVAGTVVAVVLAFVAVGSLDALSADRQVRLAIDRENSGDVAGAGDGYAAAQRATPGSSRVHEVRARWLLRTGQPLEAIEAARRAVAADPSDPYQAELLARALNAAALSAEGDTRFAIEAEEVASRLVGSSPYDGSTRLELGTAYAALGRFDEAEAEYRRAAELVPGRSEPVRNLGLLAEQRGDREGAIGFLEAALEINPGDAAAVAALDRLRGDP